VSDALQYAHPVAGVVTLIALVTAGSMGLRARAQPRRRRELLERHSWVAPIAFGLVIASWVGGALSSFYLRHDLDFAASLHFRTGALIVALMGSSALSSRAMRRGSRTARELHPWLGAAALLLAAAQAATGLRIMP
jgi:hypothetical protein